MNKVSHSHNSIYFRILSIKIVLVFFFWEAADKLIFIKSCAELHLQLHLAGGQAPGL